MKKKVKGKKIEDKKKIKVDKKKIEMDKKKIELDGSNVVSVHLYSIKEDSKGI